MFTRLYLNDSFMIRKIIVAAVPAALVAVGMSLAISEPASSQRRGGFYAIPAGMPHFQLNSGGARHSGGANTNTNQVYPNNRRPGGGFGGAVKTNGGFTMYGSGY